MFDIRRTNVLEPSGNGLKDFDGVCTLLTPTMACVQPRCKG
jgi:hypothetical protein